MAEERKLVTILFADVTGSTALGESLDPEDVRALMARYFEHARRVVGEHGGTVEKFIGDAVMAVFGLPRAHGDDAERALAAALALRERSGGRRGARRALRVAHGRAYWRGDRGQRHHARRLLGDGRRGQRRGAAGAARPAR